MMKKNFSHFTRNLISAYTANGTTSANNITAQYNGKGRKTYSSTMNTANRNNTSAKNGRARFES